MRRRRSDGWDNRCRETKKKVESKTDRESVHEKEKK